MSAFYIYLKQMHSTRTHKYEDILVNNEGNFALFQRTTE